MSCDSPDSIVITDTALETFEMRGTKKTNDEDAKVREALVGTFLRLLYIEPQLESLLPAHLRESERYLRVKTRLREAFEGLGKAAGRTGGIVGFTHQGGRRRNYDFGISFGDDPENPLLLELKYGQSIFDQPQILSLYVNAPELQGTKGVNYAHYFYDEGYVHQLCERIGVEVPERVDYLVEVFGTSGDTSPFAQLKEARADDALRLWMDDVSHRSIDSYLTEVEADLPGFLDIQGLSRRIYEQVEKYFLSISPVGGPYTIERIEAAHLAASGETAFKLRPDGRRSSLLIFMESGAVAAALLRWKNHNVVQGPAWQIGISPPSALNGSPEHEFRG